MFSKRAEMTELRRQLTQLRLEVAELSTRVAAAEAGMQDIAHHVAVGVPAHYRPMRPQDADAAGALEDVDPAIWI